MSADIDAHTLRQRMLVSSEAILLGTKINVYADENVRALGLKLKDTAGAFRQLCGLDTGIRGKWAGLLSTSGAPPQPWHALNCTQY